jgi:hypothetical protein
MRKFLGRGDLVKPDHRSWKEVFLSEVLVDSLLLEGAAVTVFRMKLSSYVKKILGARRFFVRLEFSRSSWFAQTGSLLRVDRKG